MRIILSLIVFLCSLLVNAQQVNCVYNFPVRPGTSEWDSLKTETERFKALQIPDNLLSKMSTECLIKTCINYPAFGHFTAFDDNQKGMRHLVNMFNGLQELLNRKGAPLKLVAIYSAMDSSDMKISDKQVDNSLWTIRSCYFEMMLAQDEIIDKMDESARLELIIESRRRLNHKIDNKQKNSIFSYQPTLLIMGKILDKSSNKGFKAKKTANNNMKRFIETGSLINELTFDELVEMSDSYIKSNKK